MRALIVGLVFAFVSAMVLVAQAEADVEGDSETDLELGRRLFLMLCSECHGSSGDGYGQRQDIGYARPRSFLTGRFKLASTDNGVPSDEDLMRTIRRGMFGAGMPSWSQLDERELRAVALYVRQIGVDALRKTFAAQVAAGELSAEEAERLLEERTVPGQPVEIPPEPTNDDASLARGRELYHEACVSCHGPRGQPVAFSVKTDFDGNWLVPTSLAAGIYKGGGEPERLFVRLLVGVGGTAMPGYEGVYSADDLWHLVHYLELLARPGGDPGAPEVLSVETSDAPESELDPFFEGDAELSAPSRAASPLSTKLFRAGALVVLALVVLSLARRLFGGS